MLKKKLMPIVLTHARINSIRKINMSKKTVFYGDDSVPGFLLFLKYISIFFFFFCIIY